MQLIKRSAAVLAALFAIALAVSACDDSAQQGGATQEQAPATDQQSQ